MGDICFVSSFSIPIIHAVEDAAKKNGHDIFSWTQSEHFSNNYSDEEMVRNIDSSNLIIFDVTNANEKVLYGIGFFAAKSKPMIFIADNIFSIPIDLRKFNILIYDLNFIEEFIHKLSSYIKQVLKNPNNFTYSELKKQTYNIKNVFISYTHKDKEYMDRILIHLKPLELKGLIDVWVDKKIKTGDKWKIEIEKALKNAKVALLLITADYLASDFIVNNELPPLLKNAEKNGTLIIPVIIKPCRFTRDSNLNSFQAINDPKEPIISLSEFKQEEIYDKISEELENRFN
jgi:hypothetical protein